MNYILVVKNIVNVSHLETLLSYAYYLSDTASKVFLYVTVSQSIWGKNILGIDDFKKYDLPDNIEFLEKETDIYQTLEPVLIGNFGHIGVRNWIEAHKFKNFHGFVQFDEGSGSWQSFWTLLKIGMEEQSNQNKPLIRYMVKKVLSKLIGMIPSHKVHNWRWTDKESESIGKYLPRVYASKKNMYEISLFRNETWIILTGGFVESGYVSKEEYVLWLEQVIHAIKTDENHILLKCHPAEDLSKYDSLSHEVEILETSESIDSLLWQEKFNHYKVVGEYSTALVTLNILYGIETFSVKSLVHRDITGDFKKLYVKHVKRLEVGGN